MFFPSLDHQHTKNYPDGDVASPTQLIFIRKITQGFRVSDPIFIRTGVRHFQKFLQFLSGRWISDFGEYSGVLALINQV